jgi:hypothetical protein
MKLFAAYCKALKEEDDISERAEFSSNTELKTLVVEEIGTAMKEILDSRRGGNQTMVDVIQPMFACVSFWFLIGIRVGKILRDAEIARHVNG